MSEELSSLSITVGILLATVVVSWLAGVLLEFLSHRIFAKTPTDLDDVLIESIKGPFRIAVLVAGFQFALQQLVFIKDSWRDPISDFFFVVYLLLVFVSLYRLIGGVTSWYAKEFADKTDTELDDKFLTFFRALAIVILLAISVILFLGRFGIEPTALVTTLGIGTLAVALAAQEALSDVISGFMIMLDQPFAVGDRVEILDINTWGDVTGIGLRSTRILTRDNRMVTVPNSVIGKGLVVNYSDPSTVYRVQSHVGIAYGVDVDEARRIMVDALMAEEWVMRDRPVEALLLEFGDSALLFRVRCWIENYVETRRVIDQMNTALYRALNEAGISIPYPRREVRMLSTEVSPEVASN